MIEITGRDGKIKAVTLSQFKALDGYDIQLRALDFLASTDTAFRRSFVMEILGYAQVDSDGVWMPLSTSALIDNHLETWQNIERVFEAVLSHNGIDIHEHANKPHFWANAGAEIAVGFVAKVTDLLGPAVEMAAVAAASVQAQTPEA